MQQNNTEYLNKAVNITLRLVALAVLLNWCFQVLQPFINAVLWGTILAVALYPLFELLKKKVKLSNLWAAVVVTVMTLAVLIIPSFFLMESLAKEVKFLAGEIMNENFHIPPPTENVAHWPVIGKPISVAWTSASQNFGAFAEQYSTQIKQAATWLLEAILSFGMGVIQFILATIIAGILLANAEASAKYVHKLFIRLAGAHGEEFSSLSVRTIRNVVKGIIGVAAIQTALASLGFFVAGIPGAGLWSLLCFLCCVVQIGVFPVAIPVVIYAFSFLDTTTATILSIWLALVSVTDNFLKPILLGQGAPVPMPVIFIGVIGGFMATGFSGMFIGAIVFSIAYKILVAWLNETPETAKKEVIIEPNSGETSL